MVLSGELIRKLREHRVLINTKQSEMKKQSVDFLSLEVAMLRVSYIIIHCYIFVSLY